MTARSTVRFATSNSGKLREARALLPFPIEPFEMDLLEIQAPTLELIALHKLEEARRLVDGPLFVEDVALGFDALGGFPGPYIKWLLAATGGEGIGRIAAGLDDASAVATCHLAYWDGTAVRSFAGECRGRVLASPRGVGGFGWDAWFLPEGRRETYAEMSREAKSRVSHRARAYALFAAAISSGA